MGTETVDGPAAYSRMTGIYPRRMCLGACAAAYYPDGTSDRPGYYDSADIAREAVPKDRRHYDRNAPLGAAVYFYGNHVAISGGGDVIRSTDANGIDGQIGTTTIGGIEAQWDDVKFAFWSDWFCGHPINTGPVPAASAVVPEPTGWSVGQTDFTGGYGLKELEGARWYVIESVTDDSKTIAAVCESYGVSLEQAAAWSAGVAASKWGVQLLQEGSSWWDGTGTYYAGVCVALNDVAATLTAVEAAKIEEQRAAIAAAQVPSTGGSTKLNQETPTVPEPTAVEPVPKQSWRPASQPNTGDLADLTNTAARQVGNILPDWARHLILWPLILIAGTIILTTIGVYVGLGEMPPRWVYGAAGGLIVLLPIIALIALANPTKTKK